jgi:hypothetical protein
MLWRRQATCVGTLYKVSESRGVSVPSQAETPRHSRVAEKGISPTGIVAHKSQQCVGEYPVNHALVSY